MTTNGPTRTGDHHTGLQTTARKVLKVVVPLIITVVLLTWLISKVDINNLREALHAEVRFRFIAGMMALTVISHIIRGVRWGYQLRAAGVPRIPAIAESCSIFGAYALNLVFPYLGEAWRCVYISRRNGVKLSTVVGTDIGDRISDLIVILLLCGLTLCVAYPEMIRFLRSMMPKDALSHHFDSRDTWIIAGGVVAALLIAWLILRRRPAVMKGMMTSAVRIYRGFAVLFHMKGTGAYILLTFGIWLCYFFQTYLCLFAFPYTEGLTTQAGTLHGVIPALVVFVFGSCSMAVPSNGGLGPWNIAVVFGLTLYGVDAADATAWSLIYWTWQTVAQIAAGIFAACYIAREKHRPAPAA